MGCLPFISRMPMVHQQRLCFRLVIYLYYLFCLSVMGLSLACLFFFFILLPYGSMLRISSWRPFGLLHLPSCCCFLPFLPSPFFICLMRLAHRFPLSKYKDISDIGFMSHAIWFLLHLRGTCSLAHFACSPLTLLSTLLPLSFSVC